MSLLNFWELAWITRNEAHVVPINDLVLHNYSRTCNCKPIVEFEHGKVICTHHSYDRRECFEKTTNAA